MKILLIYFSGTGNTKYITKLLQDNFIMANNQCDCFSIFDENINCNDYDIIGLGYPIYAFNSPKVFNDRLKQLSFTNKTFFIYKTSGEPLKLNNNSSSKIIRYLNKNNSFLSEYHLLMPYNIIFRTPDAMVKQMLLFNIKYCKFIVDNVLNNNAFFIKPTFQSIWISHLLKIQRLGAKLNSHLYKVNYRKCSHCNLCINNCPIHNITLIDNKFHFQNKCLMCMRCSFSCPNDAIKIGFLNHWKVNKPYNFKQILEDSNIPDTFTKNDTKGFFKYHHCYYQLLNEIIDK